MSFGASSLDFSLRCWTDQPDRLLAIKSELGMRVYEVLEAAGIGIPFPQRTVHLGAVSSEARGALRRGL
jgi:small-conductance mechanosensitive channel